MTFQKNPIREDFGLLNCFTYPFIIYSLLKKKKRKGKLGSTIEVKRISNLDQDIFSLWITYKQHVL